MTLKELLETNYIFSQILFYINLIYEFINFMEALEKHIISQEKKDQFNNMAYYFT